MRKRRQPQQTRAQFTFEAILEAVSRVIREQGIEALTTNRIAEAAGVSIGTLYQYFSNKQDIYNALHEREFQFMAERVKEAFALAEDGSLDELLVALIDAVISERLKDPDMHRLIATTIPRRTEKMSKKIRPLSLDFFAAVSSFQDELRPDCDLERFIFVLSHMIESLSNAVVLFRPPSISLEDARASAISAIRAFVATESKELDKAPGSALSH